MGLKGTFNGFEGLGAAGAWNGAGGEFFQSTEANNLRQALYMAANGPFCRSVPIGGSKTTGLRALGVIDAVDAIEFTVDNTTSYVSGSSGLTVPINVLVRVENAALSVTPRIYNLTTAAAATTSGSAACAATADDYSGTNQRQTLLLTLQSGVNVYKLQFTASSLSYQFWGIGWRSLYIG